VSVLILFGLAIATLIILALLLPPLLIALRIVGRLYDRYMDWMGFPR
jgi:hypothetical protein